MPQRIVTADPTIEKWQDVLPACVGLVPILFKGLFSTEAANEELSMLRVDGSRVAPNFMKPEGIVVFHIAGNVGFKKTIDKDELPKTKV